MASLLDPIATEETPEDDLAAEIRQDPRYNAVRQFIIDREGWQPKGTWDVNAFRAGYGSDTITLEDGRVVSVDENMSVTREDADRDIDRRLTTEFMPRARNSISPQVYDSLDADTLAVVTSLAYNFGRIPESVVEAFNTGDKDAVADSIEGLTSSNPGLNKRRQIEADMVRNSLFMSPDAQPEDEWEGVPHVLTPDMHRTRRRRASRSLLGDRIDPFASPDVGGLLGGRVMGGEDMSIPEMLKAFASKADSAVTSPRQFFLPSGTKYESLQDESLPRIGLEMLKGGAQNVAGSVGALGRGIKGLGEAALSQVPVKYRLSNKTVQVGDGDSWRDIETHDTVEAAMQHLYALRSESRKNESMPIESPPLLEGDTLTWEQAGENLRNKRSGRQKREQEFIMDGVNKFRGLLGGKRGY